MAKVATAPIGHNRGIDTEPVMRLLKHSIRSHLVYSLFLATIGTICIGLGMGFILFSNMAGASIFGATMACVGVIMYQRCQCERRLLQDDRDRMKAMAKEMFKGS